MEKANRRWVENSGSTEFSAEKLYGSAPSQARGNRYFIGKDGSASRIFSYDCYNEILAIMYKFLGSFEHSLYRIFTVDRTTAVLPGKSMYFSRWATFTLEQIFRGAASLGSFCIQWMLVAFSNTVKYAPQMGGGVSFCSAAQVQSVELCAMPVHAALPEEQTRFCPCKRRIYCMFADKANQANATGLEEHKRNSVRELACAEESA